MANFVPKIKDFTLSNKFKSLKKKHSQDEKMIQLLDLIETLERQIVTLEEYTKLLERHVDAIETVVNSSFKEMEDDKK